MIFPGSLPLTYCFWTFPADVYLKLTAVVPTCVPRPNVPTLSLLFGLHICCFKDWSLVYVMATWTFAWKYVTYPDHKPEPKFKASCKNETGPCA